MKIDMHTDAKDHFDEEVEILVRLIKDMPERVRKNDLQKDNEYYVPDVISGDDIIGDIEIKLADQSGNELGRAFFYNNREYGLSADDYIKFTKVARNIQRISSIRKYLSLAFIKEEMFSWMKKSYKNENVQSFTDYMLQNAADVTREREVWIPIPFTSISSSIKIGKVNFVIITKKVIDGWFKISEKTIASEEDKVRMQEYKTKIRKEYQGSAAGLVVCEAEPIRAKEIAYLHLSQSLAILRLFSPANHLPEFVCGAYEYGKNMYRTEEYFLVDKKEESCTQSSAAIDHTLRWDIGPFETSMLQKEGLQNYLKILDSPNYNDYQDKLLNAIMLYSKNTLRRDISDKILYILTALESILVRNETEPIQQNISDRIAFTIKRTAEERKEITQIVKSTYAIRSKFIHHGIEDFEDMELLRNFMNVAWLMFTSLVQNWDRFTTKEALLSALDNIKYS